jgi:hypothetical protein
MKRYISILITIFLVIFSANTILADSSVVSTSATLRTSTAEADLRVNKLENFLSRYNSVLADYASEFVKYADENGLDWRLLPAISGVESTFGKQMINGTYNAYGWAGGLYRFASWEDSIATISKSLKEDYLEKGAPSLSRIAKRYCPPSSTWKYKVAYFMRKIDPLPLDFTI